MTVSELIEELRKYPQDATVIVFDDIKGSIPVDDRYIEYDRDDKTLFIDGERRGIY